jgi:endoglucanase
MFELKDHLRALTETHAPSGFETLIHPVIREAWTPLVNSFQQDGLGSLIGLKKATRPLKPPRKILLAAHMDEIGMLVTEVKDSFITVTDLSGVDNRLMLAQPVIVHGRQLLPGIVASTPPHLSRANGRKNYPAWDELVIDVGLPAAEVAALVKVGDVVTPEAPLIDLMGKKVAGKAFDDRACLAAVTACLHHLQGLHHQWDVYAAATVQEEMGLYGAATTAHAIAPDIAIALDVTFAPQPGVDSDGTCEMGGGPGIGIGPNFHPKLVERIKDTARYHEIKLQDDLIPGNSGTDAWAIQVALEGIPTALLEVPIRNMHSPVETCDLRDIERAGRLMAHFIAGLDADFLAAIQWEGLKREDKGV